MPRKKYVDTASSAKACTDCTRPERVMKVPSTTNTNVAVAANMLQRLKQPRLRYTVKLWIMAMAVSQLMRLAFSTASHAQNPPQPRTTYAQTAPSAMPMVRKMKLNTAIRSESSTHRAEVSPVMRAASA